jgi:hypothetical protein
MPGLWGLEDADGHAVKRPAEMAAMGLDPELAAGLGIDLQHRRAGGAQIAHEAVLFQLAGLEEAQQAAGMARRRDPAEIIPECACAGFADDRGAEVIAETIALAGLVVGIDRRQGGRGGFGKLCHHRPSRSLRACASARMSFQVSGS